MSELPSVLTAPMPIGVRLRELREAKGISRPVLAHRLTLSDAQLRQIEDNESSLFYSDAIRAVAVRKVADFLGEPLVLQSAAKDVSALAEDPLIEPPLLVLARQVPTAPESVPEPLDESTQGPKSESPEHPRTDIPLRSLTRWGIALLGVAVTIAIVVWLDGDRKIPSPSPVVTSFKSIAPPTAPDPVIVEKPHSESPEAAERAQSGDVACNTGQGPVATFTPSKAAKDGSLVYVVGTLGQFVCVKDSRGQAWRHDFANASGRSFYGRPPWIVESPQLGAMQIYFQGVLARPPHAAGMRLRLIAADLI